MGQAAKNQIPLASGQEGASQALLGSIKLFLEAKLLCQIRAPLTED